MMLINARPRIVSHAFETFVPFQRAEPLHQRLVEMTNNDVNAWNFFRPVATSNNGWDEKFDGFNENFPLHNLYAGYYQDTSSVQQPQANNLPKTPLYTIGHQVHYNSQKAASNSHSIHQGQATGVSCVEKRSPMLANGYLHCYAGQRHGSFAEFSNERHEMRNFTYQPSNEPNLTPYTSPLTLAPRPSYQEDVPMISDLNLDTTSPSTTYSGYSSTSATVNPVSLLSVNDNHHDILTKSDWWPENPRNNHEQYEDAYGLTLHHDGLPRPPKQQHPRYFDLWNTGSGSSNDWTTQLTTPVTISPKALTFGVPSAAFSTSGSSQGVAPSVSGLSSASSSRQDSPDSGPETLSVVEQPVPVRQHRQMLPDSLPRPRVLPSNNFTSRKTTQKRAPKSKSESHSRQRSSPAYNKNCGTAAGSYKVESVPAKPLAPKRIEPKPTNGASWSDSPQRSATAQALHHRDAKDDFLVKSKLAGMSYKDIRRHGNFVEAESTLRGRFRTLTKHKAARVRKPEWTDNDVRLLKKAVRKLTNGSDPTKNKVPWKQVAEYIANNGGSYHFGNATCRKRWDELQVR